MTPDPMTTDERRAKYSVPAVEKALDILEYLAENATPVPQAQLARTLGRQPGELFRMLTCLQSRGYLHRDAESGGYELTLKLFELSRTHSPYETLLKVAEPLMRELSDEVKETCHLSTLHLGQILVLSQAESPQPIRMSVQTGSLHPPLFTTSGRVLLANTPLPERDSFLAEMTDFTTRPMEDQNIFLTRLMNIRQRGYEIADGERFVGGLDIGALVGTEQSKIKAALIVATLKRADGPNVEVILPILRRYAALITQRAGLGCSPNSG